MAIARGTAWSAELPPARQGESDGCPEPSAKRWRKKVILLPRPRTTEVGSAPPPANHHLARRALGSHAPAPAPPAGHAVTVEKWAEPQRKWRGARRQQRQRRARRGGASRPRRITRTGLAFGSAAWPWCGTRRLRCGCRPALANRGHVYRLLLATRSISSFFLMA